MSPLQTTPEQTGDAKRHPGFLEQALMTLKILLAAGAVLGGIWLLDSIAGP